MVHVAKLSFNGDPNVGMYCIATDRFVLVGKNVSEELISELGEIFKVPVIRVSIYGTPLVGIFIAANSHTILLPAIAFKNEVEDLRKATATLGIQVVLLETDNTALANNILCNDKIGIISSQFKEREVKDIEAALKITTMQCDLAGMETPGSAGVLNDKGAIFTPNLSEKEIKKIEEYFGFEIGLGTLNMGSPIIGSAAVANSHGFIVGGLSSGHEIGRVEESLGFLGR